MGRSITRQARAENYPARSVYKPFKEIQQKFHVIKKKSMWFWDLGCAPDGLMCVIKHEDKSPNGRVFGIDIQAVTIDLPANVLR